MSQSAAGRVMPMITVKSVDAIRNFYVDTLGFSHVMGMVGRARVQTLEVQIDELRAAARDEARRLDEAVAAYRQEYPARLQFPYGVPKYEKPFLVRSMWHDGEFTYVKTDATELPALYEVSAE